MAKLKRPKKYAEYKLPEAARKKLDKRKLALAVLGLVAAVVLVLIALRLLGWGDGIYEVRGKVTRAGKPIPMQDCLIVFSQRDKGFYASAKIDALGSYRVRTPQGPGLPEGTYEVFISFPTGYLPPTLDANTPLPPEELEKRLAQFIPKRYRNSQTSGVTLKLEKDEPDFSIDMTD